MLGTVLSAFTFSDDKVDQEYLYQEMAIQELVLNTSIIIPLGSETDYRFITDEKLNDEIKEKLIQNKANKSDIVYLAIDRGLTEKMILRTLNAIETNPNVKVRFLTLVKSPSPVAMFVHAINNQKFDSETERLKEVIVLIKPLYELNKTFKTTGNLTNYK